jgi:alpha-L-fucosidase
VTTRRAFLRASAAGVSAAAGFASPAFGPVPSARQLKWHQLEVYSFLHFTINTFTDKEWGYGDEDPNLFNPAAFDPDAIVSALAAGGMKGVILTCKHHDGFCLWPTKTTEHCVRNTKWRGGKGDVVREISDAARRHGLKFGVYLSPWDRNTALYASPKYVEMYRAQLRELLTQYGPLFEVWHDGANGGDGYYGGARERRTIDKRTYYDWPGTWDLVRKLQPEAVIFSDIGPDIRWVGNEKGFADETCWATITPVGEDGGPPAVGDVRQKDLQSGHRDGKYWMPAECDVSIRPGWFWHEKENAAVKTPEQLMDLYFKSVGRNASLLLNVPPDRRGLLHENDVASLAAFGRELKRTFAQNLLAGAKVSKSKSEWVAALPRQSEIRVLRIRENISLGHRVDGFAVDAHANGEWGTIAQGTSVGACRLVRLPEPVMTDRLRLRIVKASAAPEIAEFSAF